MVREYIVEHASVVARIDQQFLAATQQAIDQIVAVFKNGKKVLIAGNGGSAADAQHFAGEFVCRFKKERRALPAIALTTDTSVLTAWSNDYSFETVFARQVEALGSAGDVFIAISTSGNSKNLLAAITAAKQRGMQVISFLGGTGGQMKGLATTEISVPSTNTPRIQEIHTLLLHIISEEVEKTITT